MTRYYFLLIAAQNQVYQSNLPSLGIRSTQYVTRDGLPTKLALSSSISSPIVQRSNIQFPAPFNSKFNRTTETPRDVLNKYAFSLDGPEAARSTLDFSNIFKVDFGVTRKPLLPLVIEEDKDECTNAVSTNKPSKLFFNTTVETKT